MAVVKTGQTTSLIVRVQTGTNAAGNPIYVNRAFANVKAGSADADIYAIGQGIGRLQKYPVVAVERRDINTLINQ